MRRNSMYRVLTFYLTVSLICLAATQTPAQQNSPFEDFLDNKREGLFAGAGIAYGSTRFSSSISKGELHGVRRYRSSALSGGLQWRLGYATSEHLAFYVTSLATSLEPSLGVMMYSKKYQGYYLNVTYPHFFSRVDCS